MKAPACAEPPSVPGVGGEVVAEADGLALAVSRRPDERWAAIVATPRRRATLAAITAVHSVDACVLPRARPGADERTLVFDVRAACTLAQLFTWMEARGERATEKSLARIWARLLRVVGALHAAGYLSGCWSASNLLVTQEGDLAVVAPACEVCFSTLANGTRDRWSIRAPEIGWGVPASPSSDLYAIGQLVLATAPLAASRAGIYLGPGASPVLTLSGYLGFLAWLQQSALPFVPAARVQSAAEVLDALASHMGPDFDVGPPPLAREVELYLSHRDRPRDAPLQVDREARWFRALDGARVDLERRAAPRRILAQLVAARSASPGDPVPRDTLQRVGWPGETLVARSGAARLHVAVSTLRKLGLGDRILFREGGYLLDPDADVRVIDDDVRAEDDVDPDPW